MTSVTVLGTGAIGSTVARILLEDGFRVTVWNRTSARAAPLADAGAELIQTAPDAVSASAITIITLRDYGNISEVFAAHTMADALSGRTVINFATGTPAEAEQLSTHLDTCDARYLEGRIGCYPRSLGTDHSNTIYSGPRALFDELTPLLRSIGTDLRYVSDDVRAANALACSMVTAFHHVTMAAFFEAGAFADRYGLSTDEWVPMALSALDLTRDAIGAALPQLESGMYEGDQATLETHAEAVEIAHQAMVDAGVERDLTRALCGYLQQATDAGLGQKEFAALFGLLRSPSGVTGR